MIETAQTRPTGEVSLRSVAKNDREFLISLILDARRDELSLTGWDGQQKRLFIEHQFDAQTSHYLAVYPGSVHEIICWNGEPSGRLFTSRGTGEIAILDITVLTRFRRRGIGTYLIQSLQNEAAESRLRVRIFIESFNPSRGLFESLGFRVAEQHEHNMKYIWEPEGR